MACDAYCCFFEPCGSGAHTALSFSLLIPATSSKGHKVGRAWDCVELKCYQAPGHS